MVIPKGDGKGMILGSTGQPNEPRESLVLSREGETIITDDSNLTVVPMKTVPDQVARALAAAPTEEATITINGKKFPVVKETLNGKPVLFVLIKKPPSTNLQETLKFLATIPKKDNEGKTIEPFIYGFGKEIKDSRGGTKVEINPLILNKVEIPYGQFLEESKNNVTEGAYLTLVHSDNKPDSISKPEWPFYFLPKKLFEEIYNPKE